MKYLNKTSVIDFYADPGHGWAIVPLPLLEELNLTKKHFSSFSFIF